MKQMYLIAVIVICTGNLYAQVNLDSGLVAYYPFNGNANDESGNVNHGIVNGAALTNDRFENANSAYYFDGINDLITIPHSPLINFNASFESYTFSVWANSNDPSHSRLINKWNEINGTPYPISIQVDTEYCRGNIYNGSNGYMVIFGNVWDGQWQHLVFVVNSSTNQIYAHVNGSLVDSSSYPTSFSTANTVDLYLAFRPIHNDYYQGFIDDLRIYDRVLNNQEIDSLYNEVITSVIVFQLTVSINDGWNMVSIPGLHPVNQDVNTWWSGLTGSVFKFSGSYQAVTAAAPGEGYWMKHIGDTTYNSGDEWPAIEVVPHDPISATAGWNMIGGYENTISTGLLTTTPPGLITGTIFEYSGGYNPADNLVPGYGYWVRLTGDGVINIPPTSLSKGRGEVVEYFKDDWGKITITDNAGRSYTLYAVNGDSPDGGAGVNLDNYELPPLPPSGMFDIRFGSGRIAEDISSSIQSIEMSGIEHPVRVTVENMSITLQDESGSNINAQLNPGEEITINNSSINKLLIISGEIGVPIEYALEQNYPNPFNPSTTIKFAVPKESNVNLSIYNVLGELVSTLVNAQKKPGYYEYKFDASNLASGVYLYSITAGEFVDVKKMVLMK